MSDVPGQKKIGIVVDNYKLKKYKIELIKAGFIDFGEAVFVHQTTSIFIYVPDAQFEVKRDEIHKLCRTLEHHFKNKN